MTNVRLSLETGPAYEHENVQLVCLSEETHSHDRLKLDLDLNTKQSR